MRQNHFKKERDRWVHAQTHLQLDMQSQQAVFVSVCVYACVWLCFSVMQCIECQRDVKYFDFTIFISVLWCVCVYVRGMNHFEWADTLNVCAHSPVLNWGRQSVWRKISNWDGAKSRGSVMTWTTGSSTGPNSANNGPILTQLITDEQIQTFRLPLLRGENSTSQATVSHLRWRSFKS